MNRIETPKGVLKYRNPTILENMKLLKFAKEGLAKGDILEAKIAIIENLEMILDYSEMQEIKNFSQLNELGEEMTQVLSQIADDILDKVVGAFSKKV